MERGGQSQQQYGDLSGEFMEVEIDWLPHANKLGISLVGNKDINVMSIFICDVARESPAAIDGQLDIGDQIMEVNGRSVYGRSHLNISALLRRSRGKKLILLVRRSRENISSMAYIVNSLPSQLYLSPLQKLLSRESSPSPVKYTDRDQQHNGSVLSCTLPKTPQGFGFTIVDGEHGVAVKSIAPNGSAAEEGTLKEGDLLSSINGQDITSMKYAHVLDLLLSSEGPIHVTLIRAAPSHHISSSSSYHTPSSTNPISHTMSHNHETHPDTVHSIFDTMEEPSSSSCGGPPRDLEVSKSHSKSIPNKLQQISPLTRQRKVAAWRMGSEATISTRINPATCPILANGRETLIEINKANEPLGIGLVGGAGTTLGTIIISEVYENGAALLDSRLQPGDILLEINGIDVSRAAVSEARHLLCMCTGKVILLVRRLPTTGVEDGCCNSSTLSETIHFHTANREIGGESWWSHWREEDWLQLFAVELVRKPGKGLGISIIGRQYGSSFISPTKVPPGLQAVFVKEMLRGGTADLDGRIRPGDVILEINGKDVRNLPQCQVAALLKSSLGNVKLLLGRLTPADVGNELQLDLVQRIGRQAFECRNEDVVNKGTSNHRSNRV